MLRREPSVTLLPPGAFGLASGPEVGLAGAAAGAAAGAGAAAFTGGFFLPILPGKPQEVLGRRARRPVRRDTPRRYDVGTLGYVTGS